MNKPYVLISLIFILAIFSPVHSQLTEVTSQFFTNEIIPSKTVWIIFSSSESSSGKISELQEAAELLRGLFRFGTREIEAGKFEEGDLHFYGDDRDSPVEFKGQLTAENVVNFVLQEFDELVAERSQIAKALKDNQEFQRKEAERAEQEWKEQEQLRKKSDTILLDFQNWNSFLKGRDAYLINFYEANCSACIELNKEWEGVATELKGQVKIAKINMTEKGNEKLEEQLEITRYPSIRFYPTGAKNIKEFSLFEGTHKKFSIKEWANIKLNEKIEKTEIPALNKENYETLCKKSKGTCVIFFLDGDSSQTEPKIEALALKHLKKPITFLISRKGQQSAFEKQAEVESFPDVVMMYCNRKKMWHQGGMDLTVVDDTINEISLGNRIGFNKYKFDEEIV